MGERAFIVTQSIKKLNKEDFEWALKREGLCRLSDDNPVDLGNPADPARFVRKENIIKAYFLVCFLALLTYKILEKT